MVEIQPEDAKRAANGARFFDDVKPGWARLMNKDTLNIANPFECAAGQAFRADAAPHQSGYSYMLDAYPQMAGNACWHGFCCGSGTIREAWFAEIDKRLSEDAYAEPDDPREGK